MNLLYQQAFADIQQVFFIRNHHLHKLMHCISMCDLRYILSSCRAAICSNIHTFNIIYIKQQIDLQQVMAIYSQCQNRLLKILNLTN
mmetsp:Transcript_9890/g.22068  ORF Transcript_9890/g.22068 Transcript_9890/m.22068 type:complete len:87 (+) Transcript_9890:197-457(+)